MLHARADYNRIQDPAANPELLATLQEASRHVQNNADVIDATTGAVNIPDDVKRQAGAVALRLLAQLVEHLWPALGHLLHPNATTGTPIGKDEPVFLLRATDKFAPTAAMAWASAARSGGVEPALVDSVVDHVHEMQSWQKANGSKTPDAPAQVLGVQGSGTYDAGARAAYDRTQNAAGVDMAGQQATTDSKASSSTRDGSASNDPNDKPAS